MKERIVYQTETVYVHFPEEMLDEIKPPALPSENSDQRQIALFLVRVEEYFRKIKSRDLAIKNYLKQRREHLQKPPS